MIPAVAILAVAALVGVCTVSRWCSELQDQLDALEAHRG